MLQVIEGSQSYGNLEQIKNALILLKSKFSIDGYDYIIKGIENTLKDGYELKKTPKKAYKGKFDDVLRTWNKEFQSNMTSENNLIELSKRLDKVAKPATRKKRGK